MGVSEKWKPQFSDGPGLATPLRDSGTAMKRRTPSVSPLPPGVGCGSGPLKTSIPHLMGHDS